MKDKINWIFSVPLEKSNFLHPSLKPMSSELFYSTKDIYLCIDFLYDFSAIMAVERMRETPFCPRCLAMFQFFDRNIDEYILRLLQ